MTENEDRVPTYLQLFLRFAKIIFPGGLASCSTVIGVQPVFEVVSPSATVHWIKYLISLVLTYVVHWKQHQLIFVLQICG